MDCCRRRAGRVILSIDQQRPEKWTDQLTSFSALLTSTPFFWTAPTALAIANWIVYGFVRFFTRISN
jgi:hypothetical protein